MKVKILDLYWNIKIIPHEELILLSDNDKDIQALTDTSDNNIFFTRNHLDLSTVIHELTHASFKALCIDSAELKTDQMEEVFCEFMGTHGEHIIGLAKHVYKKLCRSKKKNQKQSS